MKTTLAFLALALSCFGQETVNVTLKWEQNWEADLTGYRVYVGTASGAYAAPVFVPAGTVQKTFALPKDVLHYATITAVNSSNLESVKAAEIVFQVFKPGEGKAPSAPVGLHKVTALEVTIEKSSDLRVWTAVSTQRVEESALAMFYRLRLATL